MNAIVIELSVIFVLLLANGVFAMTEIAVVFNGKELFTAEDATHKEAGKVGVWTKADSVTLFDDFSYGTK
jgi:CBS domain containing-hemolysin-like protein